jgi:hypothetical protein
MKHDDDHNEIGAMLRSHKPEPVPAPGLEARILRELDRKQRPAPSRRWVWFVAPAAFAAVVVVMSSLQASKPVGGSPETAANAVKLDPAPEEDEASAIVKDNPLKRESVALTRDARRAGRFLIDCLPSAGK